MAGRRWHAPRSGDRYVSRRFAQQRAVEQRRALTTPYRLRVQADAEGLPVVPGRCGRIEWYCDGVDCAARFGGFCPLPRQLILAVYTDRPRLFEKLWAIPGVKRHQSTGREMRAVFPAEALCQVARVIRAKRWGGAGRGRLENLRSASGRVTTSRLQEKSFGPGRDLELGSGARPERGVTN
jgi:hypothetical protein